MYKDFNKIENYNSKKFITMLIVIKILNKVLLQLNLYSTYILHIKVLSKLET